ncbi:MAG: LAGLIDADG family homing endonuclease [Candidatus Aminicenantales bacterium]
MNENVLMGPEDYEKMPKLRTFLTPKMREILEKSRVLEDVNTSYNNKRRYKIGERSLPLKYLSKNHKALSEIIKLRPVFITHGGVKVTLPDKINSDIAYLTGLICGDGNLTITKKRDYWVTIHNKEIALLEKTLAILETNFNYKTDIKEGNKCQMVVVRSEVIHSFFHKIMEIESGRKENIKIPKKIKSDRKLIRAFIAGFFDAEGTVALKKNKITCQICLYQKQKSILDEIKSELEKDGIEMKFYYSNTNHRLYGNRKSLKPFYKKIKIFHPKKKKKLDTAIKNHALWMSGNSTKVSQPSLS